MAGRNMVIIQVQSGYQRQLVRPDKQTQKTNSLRKHWYKTLDIILCTELKKPSA